MNLFCLILGTGFLLSYFHTPWNHAQHIRYFTAGFPYWHFHIDQVKNSETSLRLEGRVLAVADSTGGIQAVTGRLLLYLPSDSLTALVPGDQLLVNARVQPIGAPKNPMAFDFAAYMAKKGIYHQAFVQPDEWAKMGHQTTVGQQTLGQIRAYCLNVLSQHLPGTHELSIGAALIIGYRTLLDDDIRDAYTTTGAIHVLAVSGLHVGIIFLGLTRALNIMGWKGRSRRWSRSLLLLIAIWGFAVFTGGSPSVLRATGMFSFLIIGEAFYRRQDIYNTLAASAFLLLCVQPSLILDIGFQLSYLAVFGIVFFQGRIYRCWYIKNPVGNYFWQLTSVSIAAQLTTLPVSLFYFHQFPLYFWLSGWIVVPAAAVILVLGLPLFFLSKIGIIATALGTLLYWVIWLMNTLILYIQQIPAGLLTGIWVSSSMVGLLYLSLASLMSGLSKKRVRPIQWALIGLILWGSWNNWVLWKSGKQQIISIYHLYRHSAVDFFDGPRVFSLSDLPPGHPKLQMATENFRAYHRIRQVCEQSFQDTIFQEANFFRKGNFVQLGTCKLAIVDRLPERVPPEPIALDYLLLRGNPKLSIADLDVFFTYKTIIFDASNSRSKIKIWKETCIELARPFHDIDEQGALVTKLN